MFQATGIEPVLPLVAIFHEREQNGDDTPKYGQKWQSSVI